MHTIQLPEVGQYVKMIAIGTTCNKDFLNSEGKIISSYINQDQLRLTISISKGRFAGTTPEFICYEDGWSFKTNDWDE